MLLPREYKPGERLFAQVPLRFAGVDYVRGAELPAMHRNRHRNLWLSGKASHLQFGVFDKRGRLRKPVAAPVIEASAPPQKRQRRGR